MHVKICKNLKLTQIYSIALGCVLLLPAAVSSVTAASTVIRAVLCPAVAQGSALMAVSSGSRAVCVFTAQDTIQRLTIAMHAQI